MPTERIPEDVHEKVKAIQKKRGYKSFGLTLKILLGNLDPKDIPEVGGFDIQLGIVLKSKPFIKKRTIIKVKE